MADTPVGACEFFDPKPFIQAANILTAADEPLMALKLLELLPGYYRDHTPAAITSFRAEILKCLVTANWYSKCHDTILHPNHAVELINGTLRGREVFKDVAALNAKNIIPHITELAPGEFWLPIGLLALGCAFDYYPIGLNKEAEQKAKEFIAFTRPKPEQVKIYCAFEIIEHLHNESDIRVESERLGIVPDIIHISTPLYSYDGRMESLNWIKDKKDLGHIRTYTPNEFAQVAMRMFSGYHWSLIPERVMHLRGNLNGHK